MDGFRWADNIGRFDVTVHETTEGTIGAFLQNSPSHGSVELSPDGAFNYQPNAGFVGFDQFTYEVRNGRSDTESATVLLRVGDFDLPGDYNGNNQVEQADLDLVLLNWREPALPKPAGWLANLPSGSVDQDELDAVLLNWGSPVAAAVSADSNEAPLEENLVVDNALTSDARFSVDISPPTTNETRQNHDVGSIALLNRRGSASECREGLFAERGFAKGLFSSIRAQALDLMASNRILVNG